MDANRSFEFISIPPEPPTRHTLTGHDRLQPDCYHGSLTLQLTALTPVSIAAGITALGSDVGAEDLPLVRVMVQNQDGYPILQGTSLKGCLRAIYETITNSTFGIAPKVSKRSENLTDAEQRIEDRGSRFVRRGNSISPAEQVFGAMGLQGLVSIADAVGDRSLEVGSLPPMFQPRAGRGRKFYRHQSPTQGNPPEASSKTSPEISPTSNSEVSPEASSAEPEKPPSTIQQAAIGTVFTTTLRFTNLTLAQLGALLIALGQDPTYPFALKLGAGKGMGMGSVAVSLADHAITRGDALKKARYLSYAPVDQSLSDGFIQEALTAAHAELIHGDQLSQLQAILHYPQAPS